MEQRRPNFEAPGPAAASVPRLGVPGLGVPESGAPPVDDAREARLPADTVPSPRSAPGRVARDRRDRLTLLSEPSAVTARRRMSLPTQARTQRPPDEHQQARRRMLLLWTKWLLPIAALLLLGSIAAWPELNRSLNAGRVAYHQAAGVNLDSGRMLGARYRGLDAHGRPYMITADEARQSGPDRIDLVRPVADSLTQNGTWVLIHARSGVYMPHAQILDLFDHVTLYRDDGTLMDGPTAVMDIRRGIVLSDDWVHAEGPFGVLDAQGDLMSQRDGVVQFRGPARMILNDDRSTRGAGR